MEDILVLNIEAFKRSVSEADFYANYFSKHLKKNRQKIAVPHKHDFFLVVLFTQGTGSHEIDFKTYPISKGSVFILKPGQMHNWVLSDDIEGYIFFHSQAFFRASNQGVNISQFPFFSSSYNPPSIQLNARELQAVIPYFKMIITEAFNEGLMKYQKVSNLISLVYIELSRLYLKEHAKTAEPMSQYGVKLLAFEQCVETHYKTQKTASAYADMLHMSTRHLNRICNTMVGKTTLEIINDRIVLEAKRLLLHSTANFSEIAFNLGYDDYAYFSRVFKTKVGMSPTAFKQEKSQKSQIYFT